MSRPKKKDEKDDEDDTADLRHFPLSFSGPTTPTTSPMKQGRENVSAALAGSCVAELQDLINTAGSPGGLFASRLRGNQKPSPTPKDADKVAAQLVNIRRPENPKPAAAKKPTPAATFTPVARKPPSPRRQLELQPANGKPTANGTHSDAFAFTAKDAPKPARGATRAAKAAAAAAAPKSLDEIFESESEDGGRKGKRGKSRKDSYDDNDGGEYVEIPKKSKPNEPAVQRAITLRNTQLQVVEVLDDEEEEAEKKKEKLEEAALSALELRKPGDNLKFRPQWVQVGGEQISCPKDVEFHASEVEMHVPRQTDPTDVQDVHVPYAIIDRVVFSTTDMFYFIGFELKPLPPDRLSHGVGLERFNFRSQDPRHKTVILWLQNGKHIKEIVTAIRTKHSDALKADMFVNVLNGEQYRPDLPPEEPGRARTRSQSRNSLTTAVPTKSTVVVDLLDYSNMPVHPVLSYPPDAPNGITLTTADLQRLAPDEFLNDSIIDFYLRYLLRAVFPSRGDSCYVFSSFFYSKLMSERDDVEGKISPSIHRWTRNEDIFRFKYLIVPINEKSHWSVAIVCNAGKVAAQKEEKAANKDKGSPSKESQEDSACILFFDSLSLHAKTKIAPLLRLYLNAEWRQRKANITASLFTGASLPHYALKLPTQNNSSDCGVYLLKYVSAFLEEEQPLNRFLTNPNKDHSNWFTAEEATSLRHVIRMIIERLRSDAEGTAEERVQALQLQLQQQRQQKAGAEAAEEPKTKPATAAEDNDDVDIVIKPRSSTRVPQSLSPAPAVPPPPSVAPPTLVLESSAPQSQLSGLSEDIALEDRPMDIAPVSAPQPTPVTVALAAPAPQAVSLHLSGDEAPKAKTDESGISRREIKNILDATTALPEGRTRAEQRDLTTAAKAEPEGTKEKEKEVKETKRQQQTEKKPKVTPGQWQQGRKRRSLEDSAAEAAVPAAEAAEKEQEEEKVERKQQKARRDSKSVVKQEKEAKQEKDEEQDDFEPTPHYQSRKSRSAAAESKRLEVERLEADTLRAIAESLASRRGGT